MLGTKLHMGQKGGPIQDTEWHVRCQINPSHHTSTSDTSHLVQDLVLDPANVLPLALVPEHVREGDARLGDVPTQLAAGQEVHQ